MKRQATNTNKDTTKYLVRIVLVKALVRWATGEGLTNRLPKLSLITPPPPSEQRDSWSSYGAVRAYSEVLLQSLGTQGD